MLRRRLQVLGTAVCVLAVATAGVLSGVPFGGAADVNVTLDREAAVREVVRVENYLKRSPPDVKEALRELEEASGLQARLTKAPLFKCPEQPPAEEEPPPPPPPTEEAPFRTIDGLAAWEGQHWPSRSGALTETTFAGRPAIKMDIHYGDASPGGVTVTDRGQLETASFINEGEVVYVHFSFFIPDSPAFPSAPPAWGVNLAEIYSERGDGSPSWQIQAKSSTLISNFLGGSPVWMNQPLSKYRGHWVEAVFGMKYAREGWVEQWLTNPEGKWEQVIPRTNAALVGNAHSFAGRGRFIIQVYYEFNSNVAAYFGRKTYFTRTFSP